MKLGDMTPAQRSAAITRAAGRFQDELNATAPAIAAILDETHWHAGHGPASAMPYTTEGTAFADWEDARDYTGNELEAAWDAHPFGADSTDGAFLDVQTSLHGATRDLPWAATLETPRRTAWWINECRRPDCGVASPPITRADSDVMAPESAASEPVKSAAQITWTQALESRCVAAGHWHIEGRCALRMGRTWSVKREGCQADGTDSASEGATYRSSLAMVRDAIRIQIFNDGEAWHAAPPR